jgi:riboflavin kinase/FMN adenylyltransferase
MKVIRINLDNIESLPEGTALCLGYFDGIHVGHQTLINRAVQENAKTAVMTFNCSPKLFISDSKNHVLTSLIDKEKLLEELNVDFLLVLEVSNELMSMSNVDFVDKILKKLNPISIYCGKDFRFGKNKAGTIEELERYFKVIAIDLVDYKAKKIASRRIIKNLFKGNINIVNKLLGRNYTISGKIVSGLGNGKKIGFKTANLDLDDEYFLPKNGVYIVEVEIDNKIHKALANVGVHPTIEELSSPIVEIYFLKFITEIISRNLKVSFLKFIRSEKKFKNLFALSDQIREDVKAAEDYFKK